MKTFFDQYNSLLNMIDPPFIKMAREQNNYLRNLLGPSETIRNIIEQQNFALNLVQPATIKMLQDQEMSIRNLMGPSEAIKNLLKQQNFIHDLIQPSYLEILKDQQELYRKIMGPSEVLSNLLKYQNPLQNLVNSVESAISFNRFQEIATGVNKLSKRLYEENYSFHSDSSVSFDDETITSEETKESILKIFRISEKSNENELEVFFENLKKPIQVLIFWIS